MKLIFLLFACSSCASAPSYFTTTCGMEYHGDYDDGTSRLDADEIQMLENAAVEAGLVKCSQIKRYALWSHRKSFQVPFDPPEFWRAGSTWCNEVAPRVELAEGTPHVLLHELVHVTQGCVSPLPVDEGLDLMHSNWNRDGWFARIGKTEEKLIDECVARQDGTQCTK